MKAYVPFDGTAEDVVGSNSVVVSGAPTFVKSQGGFYKGLSCAGTGSQDYVSISNELVSPVGAITLWYYARGPWYNYQTVFDNLSYQEYWECWIYENGILAARVSNKTGGGDVRYDLDNLRGPDNWYHIAFVWNLGLGQTRLYVDGVLRATASLTAEGWMDPHPTLNLAGGHAGNSKGNGIWDEVRVYDRALTDEEIAALTVIPPIPPPGGTLIRIY
ncbi:MAG TPA: LamG domain-containing protein [Kiritimatiellia bacterium]|nr:LamG domain-containing protein [Kiritimatiellia bacterium]HRU71263.1 LamG domain-containing protein [Kiritimatiellia bacterium]